MSSVLADLLVKMSKDRLSTGEQNTLWKEANILAATSRDLGGVIGRGGAVKRISSGNLEISQSGGVRLFNPATGKLTVNLETDGDASFGSNLELAADTSLKVFSVGQTYNDEAMGAGDVLMGDNSASKANLLWDRSTGKLLFRSGTTSKITLGTDGNLTIANTLQSNNYSSGMAGFSINGVTGDAEFNNITARGELHSAVFTYGEIHAAAGTLGVFKSAGKLRSDATTLTSPAQFEVNPEDPDTGHVQLFAVNDILRLKDGSGFDNWVKVNTVIDQTTYYQYNCILQSGTPTTFRAGAAIADYGPSGQGAILLSADGTIGSSANMSIISHAGAPWTTQTLQVRLGNMNGSYGTGANDRYGIGIGDYTGGNYLSYNAETADAFILKAGGGVVVLDANGLAITTTVAAANIRAYQFKSGATVQGGVFSAYDTVPSPPENLLSLQTSGLAGASSRVTVESFAPITYNSKVTLGARSGTTNVFLYVNSDSDDAAQQYVRVSGAKFEVPDGDLYTVAWTDYSATSTVTGWSSFTTKKILYKKLGKLVFVKVDLDGTSDATTVSFTLLHTQANDGATLEGGFRGFDNGAYVAGLSVYSMAPNSNTVNAYLATGNWTASGRKLVRFWFVFEATA